MFEGMLVTTPPIVLKCVEVAYGVTVCLHEQPSISDFDIDICWTFDLQDFPLSFHLGCSLPLVGMDNHTGAPATKERTRDCLS